MASTAAVHRLPLICAAVGPASVVCVAASGRPQAPAASTQGICETILNTLVAFDMVLVPGGTVTIEGATMTVEPFLIGRTEVTWDEVLKADLNLMPPTIGFTAMDVPPIPIPAVTKLNRNWKEGWR